MARPQPSVMLIIRELKSELPHDEFERRYKERLPRFREVPGLVQKYYAYDDSTKEWAGIYLWDSNDALEAFLESDLRKTIASAYQLQEPPRIERYPIVDVLRT